MAGNYPNVPSWRLAYDRDGTQGYVISGDLQTVTQLTSAQMKALNDESATSQVQSALNGYMMFWFPETRDLDGYFFRFAWGSGQNPSFGVEVSANTTNGVDGTWTSIRAYGAVTSENGLTSPDYRSNIASITALGIRAVRFRAWVQYISEGQWVQTVHLYGEPIPGANPNRLTLWHPTLDQRIVPAHFDWGDVPRSSSADKQFRVKNLSSTLTANSIRVAQEILTDVSAGNPSVPGQHSLSTDGSTFLAQVNVGNLAPGAISGVVTLRRNTPSNAQLGLWAHRVFAEATTWS